MSQEKFERRTAVLVCLPEPLLKAGVRTSLANEQDMEVIDSDLGIVRRRIDVVVTDGTTAARIAEDGRRFEAGQSLQFARILVIAAQGREHAVRSALEQGIHGFVLTSSPVCDLLAGIRALARGGNYLCASVAQQLAQVSSIPTRGKTFCSCATPTISRSRSTPSFGRIVRKERGELRVSDARLRQDARRLQNRIGDRTEV